MFLVFEVFSIHVGQGMCDHKWINDELIDRRRNVYLCQRDVACQLGESIDVLQFPKEFGAIFYG